MKQVEVYFDYLCPYCYEGHKNLKELLPHHPDAAVVWMPCEAHPRPEQSKIYSDVAIMGMYFLRDNGGDVDRYNDLVYAAHFEKGLRIDDLEVLSAIAEKCGADPSAFREAVSNGRYAEAVLDGNRRAWGEKGWEAVPSYSGGGKDIGSRGGILVPKKELDRFLSEL
ncbi:MAG: hypothetical protein HFJ85_00655 [Oscillospiraceae bacterium]|nr:hypothetical protein [Oscillospiraceae bacterium]